MTQLPPSRASGEFIDRLTAAVGLEHVLVGTEATVAYTTDWTRRFHGPSTAVVRPANVTEVAEVVRACGEYGVAIVPQGGNTGLVGGSVPGAAVGGAAAPIVMSTSRLNVVGDVDVQRAQVTAQAGVTVANLRQHAHVAGWEYGVDLAARDTATVGGTIATNAGGVRVCAYGTTRAQVLGVQAVMADGSVIEQLSGLVKDNSGYDLAGLLTGSEGTLAIVTAARLRLVPRPRAGIVTMMGVATYDEGIAVLTEIRAAGLRVLAAEIMDAPGTRLVCDVAGLPWPLMRTDHSHIALFEVEETETGNAVVELGEVIVGHRENSDSIVATDVSDRVRLWSYRERQTEAVSTLGVVHKLDVSVPLSRLQDFADGLVRIVSENPVVEQQVVFGHLAEANLHIEIVGPDSADERVDAAVLAWAASCGGSVSAEHGIGRAKAAYLPLCRSADDIKAMATIKRSLDPRGIFNPGVLFA